MNQTATKEVPESAILAGGRWEDFVTIQEAATLLRVSSSTVWRWLRAGRFPAYRVGERRVWLNRADLASLVKPTENAKKGGEMKEHEQGRERRLTEAEQRRMLDAVDAARILQAEMLEARGGRLFRSAAEDIAEAREERSAIRS